MTTEEIKPFFEQLATTPLTKENIDVYMKVMQKISKVFDEETKHKKNPKSIRKGNATYQTYDPEESYVYEIGYTILFFHRYANMKTQTKTKFTIMPVLKDVGFLTPAYLKVNSDQSIQLDYGIINMIDNNNHLPGMMKTILHENRHASQFRAFLTKDIKELLNYDPNNIFIVKENILFNKKGNDFYLSNHSNSIMERDADLFAKSQLDDLIPNYFPEQQNYYQFLLSHKKKFENPFLELEYDTPSITYQDREGNEVHLLLEFEKYSNQGLLKEEVQNYPILQILYHEDGTKKTYEEILNEKNTIKQSLSDEVKEYIDSPSYKPKKESQKQRLEKLYRAAINSDLLLSLEDKLARQNPSPNDIIDIFETYPDLYPLYHEQIEKLLYKYLVPQIDRPSIQTIFQLLKKKMSIDFLGKIEEKTSQDDDEEYERFRRLAIEKYLIDDEEMISNLYRRHMKLKEEREAIEEDELEQERRRIR